jgi:hypothetical protein
MMHAAIEMRDKNLKGPEKGAISLAETDMSPNLLDHNKSQFT